MPTTQPQLEYRFDAALWAATAVDKPAVVLIDVGTHAGILLAKHAIGTSSGCVRLYGVRWVRLPMGWRLLLLRCLSRLGPVRLPAEYLFNEILLDFQHGLHRAWIEPQGPGLPHPRPAAYPLRELTHGQFDLLSKAPGRLLLAQVTALFPGYLVHPQRTRTREWPANRLSPWPLFTGT